MTSVYLLLTICFKNANQSVAALVDTGVSVNILNMQTFMRFRILELQNQVKWNNVTLRVTNSKTELSFIHFRVTNSKLKNRKFQFRVSSL